MGCSALGPRPPCGPSNQIVGSALMELWEIAPGGFPPARPEQH
jgi:hypothetical protein